jgi:hypothetical protein
LRLLLDGEGVDMEHMDPRKLAEILKGMESQEDEVSYEVICRTLSPFANTTV